MTKRKINLSLALAATVGLAIGGSLALGGLGSVLYEDTTTGRSFPWKISAGYSQAGDAAVNVMNSPAPTALGQVQRITSLNPLAAQWQTPDAGTVWPPGTNGQALINATTGTASGTTYTAQNIPTQKGDHKVKADQSSTDPGYLDQIVFSPDYSITVDHIDDYLTLETTFGPGANQSCSGATCAGLQPALPTCTDGQIWESSSGLPYCESPPWQMALPVCTDGQIWDSVSSTPTCMTPAWTNTPLSNNAPPLVAAGPSVAGSSTSAARSDGQPGLSATPPNYGDFLRANGVVVTKVWTATYTGSVTSTASATSTASQSRTDTGTATSTASLTVTGTATGTGTVTGATATATGTGTVTGSHTNTYTLTGTGTVIATATGTVGPLVLLRVKPIQ